MEEEKKKLNRYHILAYVLIVLMILTILGIWGVMYYYIHG